VPKLLLEIAKGFSKLALRGVGFDGARGDESFVLLEERGQRRGQHGPTLRPKPEKIASQELGGRKLARTFSGAKTDNGSRLQGRGVPKVKICFMR
jgi:hypothetical protein